MRTISNFRSFAWLAFAIPAALTAANNLDSPVLNAEPPTYTSIGLQLLYNGDDNTNATATLRYRRVGDAAWTDGMPLRRPGQVDWITLARQFNGSILDLRPATQYEYQVQLTDPDGFSQLLSGVTTTRALAAPPATPRNVSVNSVASLQAAVNAAQPGDIITLQPGVYHLEFFEIHTSGTAANPIILRGASRDTVILDGNNCDCNIIEVYGSYIRLESLTFRNAQQAIRFFMPTTGIMFTRNRVYDVYRGINSEAGQSGFVFADNYFTGRFTFGPPFGPTPLDTYGIQLLGSNHVIAHNQIRGFNDGLRLFGGGNRNCDIYGNDIQFTIDDGMEIDNSYANIRVQRNRIFNVDSGISTQPVTGGPAYLVRNVIMNVRNEEIKFHAESVNGALHSPSGVLIYHNTFVNPVRGLSMFAGAAGYDSVFRNNIFYGPNGASTVVAWDGPLFRMSFDYDGFYPNGTSYFNWQGTYVNYSNLAAIFTGGLVEPHGIALSANLFRNGLAGGSDGNLYLPPQLELLSAGANAIDAATPIPNVNNLFSGAAPDLGALEAGCPPPPYGPRPAGINESNQVFGCQQPALAANTAPVNGAVSPVGRAGSPYVFTATATDANGYSDLENVTLLFAPSPTLSTGCAAVFKRSTESLYLWNDAGSALLGPVRPGQAATVENSRCSINGNGSTFSYTADENRLTVSVNIAFKNGFRNLKNIYLQSADLSGTNTSWTLFGTWR